MPNFLSHVYYCEVIYSKFMLIPAQEIFLTIIDSMALRAEILDNTCTQCNYHSELEI